MDRESVEYDDELQTRHIVIDHHPGLLSRLEWQARDAFISRRYARAYGDEDMERQGRELQGSLGDERIDAILEQGWDVFSRNVTERVLREHAEQVVLNRCPNCSRIPRTPRARQCCWCHHDWH